jgi:hypothetical protein
MNIKKQNVTLMMVVPLVIGARINRLHLMRWRSAGLQPRSLRTVQHR